MSKSKPQSSAALAPKFWVAIMSLLTGCSVGGSGNLGTLDSRSGEAKLEIEMLPNTPEQVIPMACGNCNLMAYAQSQNKVAPSETFCVGTAVKALVRFEKHELPSKVLLQVLKTEENSTSKTIKAFQYSMKPQETLRSFVPTLPLEGEGLFTLQLTRTFQCDATTEEGGAPVEASACPADEKHMAQVKLEGLEFSHVQLRLEGSNVAASYFLKNEAPFVCQVEKDRFYLRLGVNPSSVKEEPWRLFLTPKGWNAGDVVGPETSGTLAFPSLRARDVEPMLRRKSTGQALFLRVDAPGKTAVLSNTLDVNLRALR